MALVLAFGQAIFAAILHAQAQEDLRVALRRQADQLVTEGYESVGSEVVDAVIRGQSKRFPVQLLTGATNAMIAGCGTSCDLVELALYDFQHNLLMRAGDKQSIAIVSGNPKYTGLHEIEIAVPGCRVERCEIGLIVMRQKPIELPPGPALQLIPQPPAASNNLRLSNGERVRELQQELRRVGCDPGAIDGEWGPSTKAALSVFAKLANTALFVDEPTEAALAAIRGERGRTCPKTDSVESGKSYTKNYDCCLSYYRGEQSLEGWGPAERCRRNMAAVQVNFCQLLRQYHPSRR